MQISKFIDFNAQIVQKFPVEHYSTFVYLTSLAREILYQENQSISVKEIATIFASSVLSMCECLIRFLETLPDPVVPHQWEILCLESSQNYTACRLIVQKFPVEHYNTFVYLTSLAREILYQENQSISVEEIATIFASVLIRPLSDVKFMEKKKIQFILHFLSLQPQPIE
ncbi:hypothetical protein O9G_000380 [Rozella allomycis CSF55]|uniref:Rho-GAP domain-containing protein n=1 Tax=Rozella allomycis (strain CSF55) TaxID=988480 RepID=A0A075AU02_ROZAC|nr:hypothetical protein O9G_000380 [Rozella allomycis CSF55]|eukprot:EPZ33605.1 hypothetical protein O9G_000380 [Rozella allomycis CSF55]